MDRNGRLTARLAALLHEQEGIRVDVIRMATGVVYADYRPPSVVQSALAEVARAGGGSYQEAEGALKNGLELTQPRFVDVVSLEIRNATNGAPAARTHREPDGSFSALIPVEPGENELEVVALSASGIQQRRTVTVVFEPGVPETPLSESQQARRERLLMDDRKSPMPTAEE